MKDITIFDNFINDEELEEARHFIHSPGTICKQIHNGHKVTEWFFNEGDNADKKFIIENETKIEGFNTTIFNPVGGGMDDATPSAKKFITKIQNKIEKCINNKLLLWRVYLNRQVIGQDVVLHTDDIRNHAYTLLIYIGDITPENYDKTGGDLEFKNKENTRIEPFTKRAVLFKGCIPHQAYAPLVPGITRISFAFKFLCMSEKIPFIVNYS
jgi:hypothetical protein